MYAWLPDRQPVSIDPLPGEIQTSASTASHHPAALCAFPILLLTDWQSGKLRISLCQPNVLLLLFIAFPLYVIRYQT
ncbi:MAG: hypothetical protein ACQEXQ_13930 [Bacillota bacterium]